MTLPYIVPIIGLLAIIYFISYQEDKTTTGNEFKAYKSVRPTLKYLAATRNINLSDEEIQKLHKTMNNAMKTMGGEYFKNKIAPKINKEINKAVSRMDADSKQNDISKLVMNTVNNQVKGILKKHKSVEDSSKSLPGRESVEDSSKSLPDRESKSLPGRESVSVEVSKHVKIGTKKRKKPKRTKKKTKRKKTSKKDRR